jgi:hypothetical protein
MGRGCAFLRNIKGGLEGLELRLQSAVRPVRLRPISSHLFSVVYDDGRSFPAFTLAGNKCGLDGHGSAACFFVKLAEPGVSIKAA